jgi:MFS family permease
MEHAEQVRRNTRLLAFAQGCIQIAFPVFLVVAGPVAKDLSGTATTLGVLAATYSVAAAVGALVVGRWMDRAGRRPGLVFATVLTGASGVVSAVAVGVGSVGLLLASAIPFGVGSGASNLARSAVADMYPPEARGRAVGVLLAAGTVGAVGSPLMLIALGAAARRSGVDPDVAAWSLVVLGSIAATVFLLRLRPDPRDLAVDEGDAVPGAPVRRRLALLRDPRYRLALFAAIAGQLAMVGVMTATPTALHDHGHGDGAISLIISVHITGMFAFGPWLGALMDRMGRMVGLAIGAGVSAAGATVAGLGTTSTVVGVGLFLLGIGWSATFLGATAVISDITAPSERAGALGLMDLCVMICSAAAGLASGIVLQVAGFRWLGLGVAAAIVAGGAVVSMRERVLIRA